MVIIAPLTTAPRRLASHVPITPPEGGLDRPRFIMCEAPRSISTERLVDALGWSIFRRKPVTSPSWRGRQPGQAKSIGRAEPTVRLCGPPSLPGSRSIGQQR
ncbi:MAG: type II toxin-antitoxin system PemK/MazF family toxin [Chloroflexota bacterium]